MKKGWYYVILFQILLIGFVVVLINNGTRTNKSMTVVAAENFYGDLASQIGGYKINVVSMVSDPNADPHEFESSSKNAIEYANARLVIENGLGYDSWSDHLLSANPSLDREVIISGDLLGLKQGDNPHVWYDLSYVKIISKEIFIRLSKIDPPNRSYYSSNYSKLEMRLDSLVAKQNKISLNHQNTNVSSTESIFYYFAKSMNLNVVSPENFMQSVSEGNDPSAISVAQFIDQLNSKTPSFLIYNLQTETPITQTMKNIAIKNNIKIIGITETMPTNSTYEKWISDELDVIDGALK